MRITIAQLSDDRFAFRSDWEALCRHVQREKSDLVSLPELIFHEWWFIDDQPDIEVWQEAVEAHEEALADLHRLGARMVTGAMPVTEGDQRFNTGFIWHDGALEQIHRKCYLPDEPGFYEARWYQRGPKIFELSKHGDLTIGFMLCSEMFFPEHARDMGRSGANLLICPRANESFSTEQWLACGRTIAVVSGAFVASSNRINGDGLFGGESWVIDPNGNVLGMTSAISPFITVDIDLSLAQAARLTYPRYIAD